MTGEEICVLAELNTEELDIDRDNALAWVNECLLQDLPKDGKVIDTETVTILTADTLTAVTKKFLSIFEIRLAGSVTPYAGLQYGTRYSGAYDYLPGYIRLPSTGSYTLTGYAIPTPMEDLDDECPVHQLFHPAVALWVASRAIAYEDADDTNAQIKMQEYYSARDKAMVDLQELMPTRPIFVKARPWV